MGNRRLIFQGITEQDHLNELKWLLAISDPTDVIISTAFMRDSGLQLIEDEIKALSLKPTVFAGIRNGITTAQALEKSLALGCKTYAIDTGSTAVIFHPKIYLSANKDEIRLIIGSANLTRGGLNGNIEASLRMSLKVSETENKELLDDTKKKLSDMITDFPEHVLNVTSSSQVQELLTSGRLMDEAAKIVRTPVGKSANRDLDTISRIKLKTKAIPRKAVITPAAPKIISPTQSIAVGGTMTLLWEGSPLTRRDLNIPDNENSNPTGSSLLKKGNSDIDQQTYFRQSVFSQLQWVADTKTSGKELAQAKFQLIIKSVDYGVHELTLSHDTRTDTATFKQHQPMTALRWGKTVSLIAKEDLLERTMRLYKSDTVDDLFIIEIN